MTEQRRRAQLGWVPEEGLDELTEVRVDVSAGAHGAGDGGKAVGGKVVASRSGGCGVGIGGDGCADYDDDDGRRVTTVSLSKSVDVI